MSSNEFVHVHLGTSFIVRSDFPKFSGANIDCKLHFDEPVKSLCLMMMIITIFNNNWQQLPNVFYNYCLLVWVMYNSSKNIGVGNVHERYGRLVYNDKFDIMRIFLMKLTQSQCITEICRLFQPKYLQSEISSKILV